MKVYEPPPDPFPKLYSTVAGGKCLGPLVPNGSVLFHDADAPLSAGDIVSLWMREEWFWKGSQIWTKILVELTPETVTLAALNPPEQHVVARAAFHAMHKVIAIMTPDRVLWDLRTLELRQIFVRTRLAERAMGATT
jgi:hypothetical protein